MIALAVLSTILLISTVVLIQIGALYTKGVNAANLQNSTRNVLSDISSSLQFTGENVKTPAAINRPGGITVKAYCMGSTRYSYVENRKLGTDFDGTVTPHVLWRDTLPNSSECVPLDISTNGDLSATKGYEMLPEHVRLQYLNITATSVGLGVVKVEIGTAFGDSDLLNADKTLCKGGTGTQYCGTAKLSTTVKRRIE